MEPETKLIQLAALQQALARFPSVAPQAERRWESGWAALDEGGGLGQAMVTELCSAPAAGALFLHEILCAIQRRREFAALIEGRRHFDPGSYPAAALERLLWVAGTTVEQGVKAADLLLRDGNLPLVLLDLQMLSWRSLARIPANTWHRFQRLAEQSGTVFIVLTPQPIVEAARVRITLRGDWHLEDLRRARRALTAQLAVQVFHRGRQRVSAAEPLIQTA